MVRVNAPSVVAIATVVVAVVVAVAVEVVVWQFTNRAPATYNVGSHPARAKASTAMAASREIDAEMRLVHPEKAPAPMDVTEFGIDIVVSAVLSAKARAPIEVIVEGRATVARLMHA
jgi:hypothetical protein